jgi:peptidoglycan/xylan/chitin deacetylase (PgdA/CDA1 family)
MKPYLVKTPKFVKWCFPKRIWGFPKPSNEVYLTFDDGPIPEVTPWVLSELQKYDAKATFFCIGDNVKKHPGVFQQVQAEGHSLGNHTFNHLNGWKTNTKDYIENVTLAETVLQDFNNPKIQPSKKLFRPPYGKLKSSQAKLLEKKGYKIVMWDVLSADFDQTISEGQCLQNVLRNIRPGSIVVFHDSLKAEKNLRFSLPRLLEWLDEKGFSTKTL